MDDPASPLPTGAPIGRRDPLAEAEATIADSEARLAAIEAALERLELGTYGRCEVCGEPIEQVVHAADPTARRCLGHGG